MKKPSKLLLLYILARAFSSAYAQSATELSEQIGACSAITDRLKKSSCFEKVARDAVAALNAANIKPVPTPILPDEKSIEISKPRSKYFEFINKAKANISADLKDATSVLWRNTFVSDGGSTMLVLCGELNAKNSYGAYIGFRRFFSTNEPALQHLEDAKTKYVIDKMWVSLCAKELEKVD